MNSLDDPLDEQLRRQFQQVFDAYDVTPPDSLKDRIWRELPKATLRRYVACSLVLVGTLFPAGGRLFEHPSPDQPTRQSTDRQAKVGTVERTGDPVDTMVVRYVTTTAALVDAHKIRPTTQGIRQRNRSQSDKLVQRLGIPMAGLLVTESVRNKPVRTSDVGIEAVATIPKLTETGQQPDEPTALASDQRIGLANEISKLPSDQDVALSQQLSTTVQETTLPTTAVSQLSIRRLSVSGLSWPIDRQVAFAPISTPIDVRMTPRRVAPDWFVRVAALSTYQQMTVVGKAGVYVQHVGSPSALSGQTWGYQISGGLSWRQWDAYVSYGQIRRWAYYDLATDDFEVKPTGSTDYQVTRRVEARSENVALPLLGVGISKQYTLGRRQQYYARMGGQATYVPSTQQTLVWAQASWGLNLPLGPAHLVQIGPAVEYSLNRIWSTERQLIIHPYTVGVSVTLRPYTSLIR